MSAETTVYAVVAVLLPAIGAYAYHLYRKTQTPSVSVERWPAAPKADADTQEPLAALLVAIETAAWPDNVTLTRPDAVALANYCYQVQVGEAAARAEAVRLREQLAPWQALLALPIGFAFLRMEGEYRVYLTDRIWENHPAFHALEAPVAIATALEAFHAKREASTHAP